MDTEPDATDKDIGKDIDPEFKRLFDEFMRENDELLRRLVDDEE